MLPPFARARRFLEHLATLSRGDWTRIIAQGASRVAERHEAARHLRVMFVTPERRIAREAIVHGARDVVAVAKARGLLPTAIAEDATSLASDAAVALIVRDLLPPEHFHALYWPFGTTSAADAELSMLRCG